MKRRLILSVVLICIMVSLLCSCQQQRPSFDSVGSEHWTVWPQINFGTMEYEKLAAKRWNSGRCEATSNNCISETENGYYWLEGGILYYADKTDLTLWLPVCSKPDCAHGTPGICGAFYSRPVVIKDNRIYFVENLNMHPELYDTKGTLFAICSRALDGSDMRLEYVNENLSITGGGEYYDFFTPEHWISNVAKLNADGSYTLICCRVSETGEEILVEKTVEDYLGASMVRRWRSLSQINGEPSFDHCYLGDIPYSECRYQDGELYFTDLTGYYEDGRYLSGNNLRLFRKNDGYYDLDLSIRKEVRVGDSHIENGDSIVFLPNCILESTLFFDAYEQIPADTTHSMVLFDGETWREVQLPEELLKPGYEKYLAYRCVTSDSIFFTYQERAAVHLYRIPIGDGELHLEYCGRIK